MLTEAERVQGPIASAIRAACVAARTRELAMLKAREAMDLGYAAKAYSGRIAVLLEDILFAVAADEREELTRWEVAGDSYQSVPRAPASEPGGGEARQT